MAALGCVVFDGVAYQWRQTRLATQLACMALGRGGVAGCRNRKRLEKSLWRGRFCRPLLYGDALHYCCCCCAVEEAVLFS